VIGKIDHVHVFVKNLEKSVSYFTKILGFKIIRKTTHMNGSVELQAPNGTEIIEIGQANEKFPVGINHIAFKVDELEKVYEYLNIKGADFFEEPHFNLSTGRWLVTMNDSEKRGWIQLIGQPRDKSEK
jgi:catechol 2,3-dioxygenase-like lactoylglutathione lyase family enzyme